MIDSLQMKYFIAVAEEKSFSAAAKRLFVSQQTLSAHIALIEKEMGIKLFERTRPLTITVAGECLLRGVRELVFVQQQMKKEIQDLTDAKQNIVRIGVSHAYARAILPLMLLKLYAAFPQINAQVFEIGYEQMKDALERQEVDFIITRPYLNWNGVNSVQIQKTDDILVYAPRSSLINYYGDRAESLQNDLRDNPSIHLLQNCPFILPRTGTVRDDVNRYFRESKIEPYIRAETEALETAIYLCRVGLGITLAPSILLSTYIPLLNNIEDESFTVLKGKQELGLSLCYLNRSYLTAEMKKLVSIAQEMNSEFSSGQ